MISWAQNVHAYTYAYTFCIEDTDQKLVWENEAQSPTLISHLMGAGRDYQLQTTDIHTTMRMQWKAKFQCLEVSCCKQKGKESKINLF